MVTLEIMSFVEAEILPRYNSFDRAHDMRHVKSVISNSLALAQKMGADENMAYVIAAYHDLGLEGPRAIHHLTSGKILIADKRLLKWFSADQLKVMKEAVEDHRASASRAPRSIYGKIVAEADRELEPDTIMRRTIEYGLDHYPEKTKEEQFKRFAEHLQEKYSATGYIHLWIPGSINEKYLQQIRQIIASPKAMRENFDRIWKSKGYLAG